MFPRRRLVGAALGMTLVGGSTPSPRELWIGGDVELEDGERPLLSELAPLLRGAAGIVNLEGPVGGPPLAVWNAPKALDALRAAGVAVVGVANNHAEDAGPEGVADTLEAAERANLMPAGGPAGPAQLAPGVVITAHDLGAGVPPGLGTELRAARGEGVLVATFHVTGFPSLLPRPELRAAVEEALDAGALVIAAHGTHALGPVERRGPAVIAWGLGNLLFRCPCTEEIDGAILRVTLDEDAVRARIIPIDAGLGGRPARPAHDRKLIIELFEAIGSTALTSDGAF